MFLRQYYDKKPETPLFYILLNYASTYGYFLEEENEKILLKNKNSLLDPKRDQPRVGGSQINQRDSSLEWAHQYF